MVKLQHLIWETEQGQRIKSRVQIFLHSQPFMFPVLDGSIKAYLEVQDLYIMIMFFMGLT